MEPSQHVPFDEYNPQQSSPSASNALTSKEQQLNDNANDGTEGPSNVIGDGYPSMDVEDDNMTEAEKQMRDEEISFYSNSENEFGDDNIWGLLSGVGGNIYEWYVRKIKQESGGNYARRMSVVQ